MARPSATGSVRRLARSGACRTSVSPWKRPGNASWASTLRPSAALPPLHQLPPPPAAAAAVGMARPSATGSVRRLGRSGACRTSGCRWRWRGNGSWASTPSNSQGQLAGTRRRCVTASERRRERSGVSKTSTWRTAPLSSGSWASTRSTLAGSLRRAARCVPWVLLRKLLCSWSRCRLRTQGSSCGRTSSNTKDWAENERTISEV
mmetsp:Transcript_20118/g.64979  ORF Transcript_20118/g.64979 Transcript_20118/m.64979 type:complete len:205 (+) Transcript_20118:419-1033(+)